LLEKNVIIMKERKSLEKDLLQAQNTKSSLELSKFERKLKFATSKWKNLALVILSIKFNVNENLVVCSMLINILIIVVFIVPFWLNINLDKQ